MVGAAIAARSWLLDPFGAPAGSVATYETFDPSTGRSIAMVPDCGPDDVAEAVERTVPAAAAWASTSVTERAAILGEFADVLTAHAEELAWLDAIDAGIPISSARSDVSHGIRSFRSFASWGLMLTGETIPASADGLHFTMRRPFGVVGRIIPFNHPAMFAIAKIGAPLTAGNAVLLKPSDLSPLSALRIVELARDVLPDGLLAVITGQGAAAGEALVRHPEVRRIAFTGSRNVGLTVQRTAAEVGVKSVTLELGGKNALIVFPDADVDRTVDAAVAGMNVHFAGQSCGSTSRLLVHESLHDQVVERVAAGLGALRVGPATEESTDTGPVVSRRQQERVVGYAERAVREGARPVLGSPGAVPAGDGHFVDWTVLDGVTPEMEVARDEIFGPVLSVMTFTEEDEAVRVANGVAYGLTASVWTSDVSRAMRVARQMGAGYVWINDSNRHYFGVPFGGVKDSGLGREESFEELVSYTTPQAFHVRI